MRALIRDYMDKISGKKAFWIPLLFFTFGGYGFSMLNRTVGVDDLATPLYVDDTVWFAELRWGAVLWKRLLSFGANVPFLDKFLSVCFLMLAGTALGCIFYAVNGRRERVWLYTILACSFITYPIISEIWEYTCGGTLIVPGDFFCTFALLLWLLCSLPGITGSPGTPSAPAPSGKGRRRAGPAELRPVPGTVLTPKELAVKMITAGLLLAPLISSAESIAPVYVATVLILLFYRYCVRITAPGEKTAWFREGVYFAVPLVIAFIFRMIIGYGIMAVMHLHYQHTGATRIAWPLTGAEFVDLLKSVLIQYGVASLVNLPITIFIVCTILFAVRCFILAVRRRSVLPVFLGICIGLSLFLITIIQGTVMYYRTAITLMVFCAFVFYLHAEDFYSWINDGLLHHKNVRVLLGRCGLILLLFITWRQAAHLHMFLALNNQRYDNEAAVMHQICYRLLTEYDSEKPLIFVGDFSNGDASYTATHDMAKTWNGRLYRRIRHKIDGTETWKSPALVQTTVASAIDFYHWEFDGQLMDRFLAYFGYDFDVIALSRKDLAPYNEEALRLGMKPFQIEDRGDYILICLGRIETDD
ncbi:MAG: glucosyltransferase domain-containing protein [Eubacteriales bacterium]|nr:glucosyltransferase domain-containing protein [Eubacteriales bacterium]